METQSIGLCLGEGFAEDKKRVFTEKVVHFWLVLRRTKGRRLPSFAALTVHLEGLN